MTTNILGIPGASLESDFKTFALNVKLKPDYAGVNLLQPYPGTEIHEYARKLDLIASEIGEGEIKEVMLRSVIKFPSESERRKVENFEKFFPVVVAFPKLMPLVKRLILLPQNRIFNLVLSLWTNYCYCCKIIPFRIGIISIWKKFPFRRLAKRFCLWRSPFSKPS